MSDKKKQKPKKKANQPAPQALPRSTHIAECFLRTTEHWGGSYFVSNYDPREPRRECDPKDIEMVCEATVRRVANHPINPTPDHDPWRYRLTLWGTDDTMLGRWFDTEDEAMSCLGVLLKNQPITFAFCDELGLIYD